MSMRDSGIRAGRPGSRRLAVGALVATVGGLSVVAPAAAQLPVVDPTPPAARDTEPVVLTGRDFGSWSARSNFTARLPLLDLTECQTFDEQCQHNHYAQPTVD